MVRCSTLVLLELASFVDRHRRSIVGFLVLLFGTGAVSTAGTSTPPLSYRAVTDRIPRPRPALPQLGAAGFKFVDPTFGTRLIRVTDPNVIPSFAPMSYVTMVNGNNTAWNADSTKFIVFLLNGYSAI